jgi:lysophospholipid acyltransferase (LPLAT)-like uncharacterized protein
MSPLHSILASLVALALRALACTWRVQLRGEVGQGAVVYAFWHGMQLPLVALHRDRGIVGMASRSRDGELLAKLIGRLGYGTIRGSGSRGGVAALRATVRALQAGSSVALAVDGPRGPRHSVHPGAVAAARLAGVALVAVRCRAHPAVRLGSWDRFCIPLPFARVEAEHIVVELPGEGPGVEAVAEALSSPW